MFFGRLMVECLRSFCLVKSRGVGQLAALGLVSMMLHGVLVPTQDLSCTYLAHHELKSVIIVIVTVTVKMTCWYSRSCQLI